MDTTTPAPAHTRATVSRARMAVSFCFFELGALTGVWAVHIPLVQAKLGIDPAVLGLALLALAIGAVVAMPITGIAVSHFGSRLPTAALSLAFAVFAPLGILSPSTPLLFISLLLFGGSMGAMDVAMNTQATEVEAARGRPTMSSFHGFYSVGALFGAILGSGMIAIGWGSGLGAVLAAIVFGLGAIWAIMNLLPTAPSGTAGPRFVIPPVALAGLGLISFLAFAGEGAIVDWSALYLAGVKQASPATAGLGYAVFSVAMTVCRLFGDAIVLRLGGWLTVLGGGALMTVGMILSLVLPGPFLPAIGYAVVGIGAANLVPVAFSAAARVPGIAPASGVAAVTTLGYSGFLVFPPVIGFLANSFGLDAALIVVAIMGVVIASMAGQVRR